MILDLIYPPVCGFCEEINKNYICDKCSKEIKQYEIGEIEEVKQYRYFDYLIKTYKYKGIIREKIIDYKFNDKSYLCDTFEKIIIKNEKIYRFLKNYDIIIYIPLYSKNAHERGYNQCKLIAKKLARSTGIKLEQNNLTKIRETKKQSTLTKKEREQNIKNAFEIRNPKKIENKKIILFDDIFTTGSTANECSRILKEAGAREVAVLTIAID